MPLRLLVYMTAIWLDYFKNSDKNKRKRKEYRLPAIMPLVLHNGENSWTAPHRFQEMITNADQFGKYVVDFEYILVSVKKLEFSQIKNSNSLVDNIFLADKSRTKEEWLNRIAELMHRVREIDTGDLNEWVIWFSNAVRKLNKGEREQFIRQLKEGDEKGMCSSFEILRKWLKAAARAETIEDFESEIGHVQV